jgi:hypothetical protein
MNLQRLRTVLGKGSQHLGDIVFWQLADARVDRATLESLWRDAGLEAALLPEEPTAERALKQAVREAQVGQRGRLIRLGLDSEAEIVFAIVRENRDDAGNVTYVQEARVRLERASEALTSDVASHDIVRAVLTGFRTLRTTHTADDVRRAIVKALGKWAAVTLRDGGGIYWVPSVYAAELRRLQGAVEKIGTSRVHVLPVRNRRRPCYLDRVSRPATVGMMTEAEYLEYDRTHDGKYEYVNGEVVAMSGVSDAHDRIQVNATVALANRLRAVRAGFAVPIFGFASTRRACTATRT